MILPVKDTPNDTNLYENDLFNTLKDTRSLTFTPKRYNEHPALCHKGVPPGGGGGDNISSFNFEMVVNLTVSIFCMIS